MLLITAATFFVEEISILLRSSFLRRTVVYLKSFFAATFFSFVQWYSCPIWLILVVNHLSKFGLWSYLLGPHLIFTISKLGSILVKINLFCYFFLLLLFAFFISMHTSIHHLFILPALRPIYSKITASFILNLNFKCLTIFLKRAHFYYNIFDHWPHWTPATI